jgi:putative glutamine amidotransferase
MKIAISASQTEKAKGEQSPYLQALIKAGAKREELELVDAGDSARLQPGEFQGLLLAGGADIDPTRYGEEVREDHGVKLDPGRDEFEFGLLDRVMRLRLPVLGICRGAQVVNVKFGGTLYQDLQKDWVPETEEMPAIRHKQDKERSETTHLVTITDPESRLAEVIRGNCAVNSTHHQGIRRPGRGLRTTARAEDGLVEAVESAGTHSYLVAVQWHPEELVHIPEHKKLLQQFLAECRRGEQRIGSR